MSKKRTRYSSIEKIRILRRHLLDKIPISKVCEEAGIGPVSFYEWQKAFFEKGAVVFEQGDKRASKSQKEKISKLENKLQKKDEVISELMEEYVKLKKNLGEV